MKNGVFSVVNAAWLLQEPSGVTTQKTPFFIVTAVTTSNLTFRFYVVKTNSVFIAYTVALL
jgi:hypothetical protein